ncbi:hypothetical protein [Pararhizobium sp. O133]|uniref:hypothetical protein n=1 Tax=Pararhizobium sp. O133 TaxID=3449278 RepID=UPI003F68803D
MIKEHLSASALLTCQADSRFANLRVAEILKTGISDEVLREIEKAKIGVPTSRTP